MGAIVPIILLNMPGIIDLIKTLHQQQNPGAPPLTNEEVHLALLQAVTSTIAKDDLWLAAKATPGLSGDGDNS